MQRGMPHSSLYPWLDHASLSRAWVINLLAHMIAILIALIDKTGFRLKSKSVLKHNFTPK